MSLKNEKLQASIVDRASTYAIFDLFAKFGLWRNLEQKYATSPWASRSPKLREDDVWLCRCMALTASSVACSDSPTAEELFHRLTGIASALSIKGIGTLTDVAAMHNDELVQMAIFVLLVTADRSSEVGSLTRDICRRDDGLRALMAFMCGYILTQTVISIETNDLANLNERISEKLIRHIDQRTFLQDFQLSRVRQSAKSGDGSIAFFCPDAAFRTHFGNLPSLFQGQGHSVLFLYGTLIGGEFEEHPTSFYVGGDLIRDVDSVDLFFTGTIMDALPDHGKRALIHHGSFAPSLLARLEKYDPAPPEDVSEDEEYRLAFEARTSFAAFYRLYDYYLVAARPFMNQICGIAMDFGLQECGVNPAITPAKRHWHFDTFEHHLGGRRMAEKICVIPSGYPQIDNLASSLANYHGPIDTITYAPTPLNGKPRWEPYASIRLAGPAIIAALLKAFPTYRIVFKPYILDHNQWTQAVLDQFEGMPNFVVDWSGSNYGDLYARSALLVSDFSSTAYTYCFATLRPVIFYSGAEDQLPRSVSKEDYCVARSKVGDIVTTPEDLVKAVRTALDNPESYRQRIAAVRGEYVYHVGESEAYIAQSARMMIAGVQGPDWRCFQMPIAIS